MDLTWSRDAAVVGYLDALTGFRDFAHTVGDADWPRSSGLPGWTLHDVLAHVAAIEDELTGRPVPSMTVDWSLRPHAVTPFQQYTEVGVEHRRGQPTSELLAELDRLVEERSAMLMQTPDSGDAELRGPGGLGGTVERVIGMRTFDVWAHECDLRRATGSPVRIDCPAGYAAVQQIVRAMPYVLAHEAKAEEGTVVRWDIGAPFDQSVALTVSEGGRGAFTAGGDRPDIVVACSAETLTVLACGRKPAAALPIQVHGDTDLGRRFVAEMSITP